MNEYAVFCSRFGSKVIKEDLFAMYTSEKPSMFRLAINHELGRELICPLLHKAAYYMQSMINGQSEDRVYYNACIDIMSSFTEMAIKKMLLDRVATNGRNNLIDAVNSQLWFEVLSLLEGKSNRSLREIHEWCVSNEEDRQYILFHSARYRLIKDTVLWLKSQFEYQGGNRQQKALQDIEEYFKHHKEEIE